MRGQVAASELEDSGEVDEAGAVMSGECKFVYVFYIHLKSIGF